MIQDIAPKKLHNEYVPVNITPNSYIVLFCKNKILIKDTGKQVEFLRKDDLPFVLKQQKGKIADRIRAAHYLFCIDEEPYFLYPEYELPEDGFGDTKDGFRLVAVSQLRYLAGQELCFAAYTAYHLYQWYRNNRYCGCCGARVVPDAKERMLYCETCGNQIYPKIAPAVIVAVTNGNTLLLTKYANREYKRYALIAGFAEIGETAEDTVRREVLEETGLHVKNIRYYKSQPWGIDGNLLFGYFAELDGSDAVSLDKEELASAEWVSRETLKDMDDSFSLTREMMRVCYEDNRLLGK